MLLLGDDSKHGLSVTPKLKNRLPFGWPLQIYVLTSSRNVIILSKIFSVSSSKCIKTFSIKQAYMKRLMLSYIKLAIRSNMLPLETV